ncbi:MAG TPA: hypothetical protein VHE55_16790 [Fimbriimonadaceae bacterium]|nr:hypothetical protein [Fimbriimonadaceae bacterium]
MKLNLLPTHVSKEKAARGALFGGILLLLVLLGLSGAMIYKARGDLALAQDGIAEAEGRAKAAKDTADYADTVMQQSTVLLRNTALAKAMLAHNAVYPNLYDSVKTYIPSFYRISSMSAQSSGDNMTTVTLVGYLDTYQQYADLMLALLRMPGVVSVSRAGFTNNMAYVPAPTPEDQQGKPHKPGEAPIPDDPLKRLDYFMAKGKTTGYANEGGYGSGQPGLRGAMPNSSEVTVTLVLMRDTRTPDPKATLSASGPAPAGSGPGPSAAGGQLPTTTTPPPSSGGNESAPGPAPRKGKRGTIPAEGD